MAEQPFFDIADTNALATGGNVTLPEDLGPLTFSQKSTNPFDTGSGIPAVAVNNNGIVLAVHSSKGHSYYDQGLITSPSAGVVWHGSSDRYAPNFGGNPGIALNDQNAVVTIQWDTAKSELYWKGGTCSSAKSAISWFADDKLLVSGATNPAVAMNNSNMVVAAFIQGEAVATQLGFMDQANRTIQWYPAQSVRPLGTPIGCSVTINDNNVILLNVITDDDRYPVWNFFGTFAPDATSIQWSRYPKQAGAVLNPSIAVDNNNVAIETQLLQGLPSYTVGKLSSDGHGGTCLKVTIPGWNVPDLSNQVQALTFAVNDSYLVVLWQEDDKYYSGIANAW